MRTRRWIGWSLTTSCVLGWGLWAPPARVTAGDPPGLLPAGQFNAVELIPPPPVPRSMTIRPVQAIIIPSATAPSPGETPPWKPMPVPNAEVTLQRVDQDIWVSPKPGAPAPATTPSPAPPPKEEEPAPKQTSAGSVSQGMITFPAETPAPAAKPATVPMASSPYSNVTPARTTAPSSVDPNASGASPCPVIIPVGAKTTAPSSIWGRYSRQENPKQPTMQSQVSQPQPKFIQGFKPAQPAQNPTPSPSPSQAPTEPVKVTAAQLQQRVIVTCGPLAQKVNILSGANGQWVVEVIVRNTKDADEVPTRVLPLQEMVATGAALKIVVGQ